MTFSSPAYFALFLPAVFVAFQVVGPRLRGALLLVASLGFYAALDAPHLLVTLAALAAVGWAFGLAIAAAPVASRRRSVLFWGSVALALVPLVGLKYLPPLAGSSGAWVSTGVSYLVFQAIAYLADVHLEVIPPERHPGWLLLSLAFFPKLLQGPIERTGDLLPQLRAPYRLDYDDVRTALLLFGTGLLKKVVLAHKLGELVDAAYAVPAQSTGGTLLLATYAYALQIYFDFSGYTDMALGSARLFGVRLTQNFRAPYAAGSVAEFWRRWHVSFSRWILDYLFKPLQLAWRGWGRAGTAAALLVAFLASGIWHGARWGFVVWGLLHGVYLAASIFWQPTSRRLYRALGLEGTWLQSVWRRVVTFHLVCLAWIFFRAATLADGLAIVRRIVTAPGRPALSVGAASIGAIVVGLALNAMLARAVSEEGPSRIFSWPTPARWAAYLVVGYCLLLLYRDTTSFIYMGF